MSDNQSLALAKKEAGTQAYKKKEFDAALALYEEAKALVPTDIVYYLNCAAVLLENGKFDECIKECDTAVEVGRSNRADFKLIARAFARKGNALVKQDKFSEAIAAYDHSLTENRTSEVVEARQKAEKLKEEADRAAYINPTISDEEKEKGNVFFRNQNFPEAIKHYSEAIKRNPSNPVLYSNRAACYTKLGSLPEAIKDCDYIIEKLDPNFAKAYIRKGHAQILKKEYYKAIETYELGLKKDPENAELKAVVTQATQAIETMYRSGDSDAQQAALRDPEIQAILREPMMQQVLNDLKGNPAAAAKHMESPDIMAKLNKLISAGILRVK